MSELSNQCIINHMLSLSGLNQVSSSIHSKICDLILRLKQIRVTRWACRSSTFQINQSLNQLHVSPDATMHVYTLIIEACDLPDRQRSCTLFESTGICSNSLKIHLSPSFVLKSLHHQFLNCDCDFFESTWSHLFQLFFLLLILLSPNQTVAQLLHVCSVRWGFPGQDASMDSRMQGLHPASQHLWVSSQLWHIPDIQSTEGG